MKVYELMKMLDEMPAGAEVLAGGSMTDKELHAGGVLDEEDGEEIFSYLDTVVDVDQDSANSIILQLS